MKRFSGLRQVHRNPAYSFADSRQLCDLILPPHAGNSDRCEDEEGDERQVRHAVRVPVGCSAVERGNGRWREHRAFQEMIAGTDAAKSTCQTL